MVKGRSVSFFWKNIIQAAEAKPCETTHLRGASGFSHPVVAVGVDEPRRRVVVISGEGDARSAAMAQGDIQAVMPSVKVVMIRPVALNLGFAAKLLTQEIGRFELRQNDLDWISQHGGEELQKRFTSLKGNFFEKTKGIFIPSLTVPINWLGVIKEAIQQLSLIEAHQIEGVKAQEKPETATSTIPILDFKSLAVLDPVEADRLMGVCSIPLYEFSEQETENLSSHPNEEEAREVLKHHDILQYFFPAADHLALGLLDREPVSIGEIINRLKETSNLGHPFGPLEVIDPPVTLNEVVDALQERGLIVEGEATCEVTPEGRSVRAKVCFRPREGLVSKLLQRFSFKVDLSLRDLFRPTD